MNYVCQSLEKDHPEEQTATAQNKWLLKLSKQVKFSNTETTFMFKARILSPHSCPSCWGVQPCYLTAKALKGFTRVWAFCLLTALAIEMFRCIILTENHCISSLCIFELGIKAIWPLQRGAKREAHNMLTTIRCRLGKVHIGLFLFGDASGPDWKTQSCLGTW